MDHVIDMGMGLAEREAPLVRIERTREQDRNEIGHRTGFDRAGGCNERASLGVMVHDLLATRPEPDEGQLMARQHERFRIDIRAECAQRPDIET